ncbi:MAG TPA: hypothetical protein VGF88_23525 [Acidobacteriaceae bacterium]|jgi:hypothetical protein
MTTREVQTAAHRPTVVPVALSYYRRQDELALHAAKRTRNGIPTAGALLERSWFEAHSEVGWMGWESSFSNICKMLNWEEAPTRAARIEDIDRVWRKSLLDWGRLERDRRMSELLDLKIIDNPAWARRHAIQEELSLDETALCT